MKVKNIRKSGNPELNAPYAFCDIHNPMGIMKDVHIILTNRFVPEARLSKNIDKSVRKEIQKQVRNALGKQAHEYGVRRMEEAAAERLAAARLHTEMKPREE